MPEDLAEAPACYAHHHVEEVPLALLEAVDPIAGLSTRRAVRVRVGVALRAGCDLPGQVKVAIQPGNATDFVGLRAEIWRSDAPDGECKTRAIAERVVLLSESDWLGNMRLVIRDEVGGQVALTLGLAFDGGGTCVGAGNGAPCTRDCQCRADDPTSRCIPSGAGMGRCEIPCAGDADCRADARPGCLTALRICAANSGCATDGECPYGQRCAKVGGLRACRPAQTGRAEVGCHCDSECGFGGVCNVTVDLAYCQLPCAVDSDCQTGDRCRASGCHPM